MTEPDDDLIPHCRHHHIILACPDDSCPEQNAYLADHEARVQRMFDEQAAIAREYVRAALGLPDDQPPHVDSQDELFPDPRTTTEVPF